jgi:membrane protease YdiL (CAAX protease family)
VKALIRNLSASAEFFLVLSLWIGITVVSRAVMIIGQMRHAPTWTTPTTMHVPSSGVFWQAVYELLTLAAVLWIGRIRGWSLKSFGLRPTWKWTAIGIFLFFATGLTARFIGMLLQSLVPSLLPSTVQSHVVSEVSLPFIILISVVNPVFEESLWGGYFIHALKRYGMWIAVLASALLRTFCHAHLGIRALVSILPMGVIYGLVYWRWRQLWPLVVAHSLQMIFSLMGGLYVTPETGSQTKYEWSWYLIGIAGLFVCTLMAWRNYPHCHFDSVKCRSIRLTSRRS